MKQIMIPVTLAAIMLQTAIAAQPPTVAVADFDARYRCDRPDLAQKVPDLIEERLGQSGLFTLLERAKLKTVIAETGWQQSGAVDPNTAVAAGKQMGARFMVTGAILDASTEQRSFNAYGVNTRTSIMRLTVSVKVLDVETGASYPYTLTNSVTLREGGGLTASDPDAWMRMAGAAADELIARLRGASFLKTGPAEHTQPVQVTIKSVPEGADVEVDGMYLGNAGGIFELSEGQHVIQVTRPGYEDWIKEKFVVRAGMPPVTVYMKELRDADLKVEIGEPK